MVRRGEVNMVNFAEEADKRMLYHVASLPSPANVVLRTHDTGVLVYCSWNQKAVIM